MQRFSLVHQSLPERLQTIAQPPACLNVLSDNWEDLLSRPAVAIVGSRKPSTYGREVTRRLAGELAGQGIVIISGLAYGVDSIAHQAALDAGGLTIAVLPACIDSVYPASNKHLASRITAHGGAVVSEYDATLPRPFKHHFVERNRLIAGLSHAVIVTEAAIGSGSRHTVEFALEEGRHVMAVPGRIYDKLAEGTNRHLFDGADMVRDTNDVLCRLGLNKRYTTPRSEDPAEQAILSLLALGDQVEAELQRSCNLDVAVFNQKLTMLEIGGRIALTTDGRWSLV